jgi:NAD(P)-dependent dehydrogenase (short-subunit alcohol dehydrogenase family)
MSKRFADRIALVAGGTGALGRAVSLALHEEGARVVVTYRRQEEFDLLRSSAAGDGDARIEGHRVDVTDEAAVRALVEDVIARHGGLDVLVNTVGGYTGSVKLWELEPQVLERMLAANLRSGFVLSRAVIPPMLERRRGAIVNVAARAALDPPAGAAAYAASKAAAVALLQSLAAELEGTGVRVNSILPAIIDTESNRRAMPGADFAKWPKPEDIARVILFLCSDDAAVVHGAAVPITSVVLLAPGFFEK